MDVCFIIVYAGLFDFTDNNELIIDILTVILDEHLSFLLRNALLNESFHWII